MRKRILVILLALALLLSTSGRVQADNYYFQLTDLTVNAFWNADGSLSLDYLFVFDNDPSAGPIEYVDLAMPNDNFDANSVYADVDGQPITSISRSDYQGEGSGVALGLGSHAIPPGQTGRVHAFVGTVNRVLHEDDKDQAYASAVLAPARFDSSVVYGKTNLTVIFHLPPGVQPEEPRWHAAPPGFSAQPETGLDDEGRVAYTWRNPNASGYSEYDLGASFPKKYVPDSAIVRVGPLDILVGLFTGAANALAPCLIPILCVGSMGGFFAWVLYSDKKRKLQYLPPKVSIEGHGIKRGLTAVEAAILMEQPLDKVLTMVLFGLVKKEAAIVTSRDPLEIQAADPQPEGLNAYESEFLAAFKEKPLTRRRLLQNMMVNLVKSLAEKMKGFSRKETVAYYEDIMKRAWTQVEAANTPEVRSQKLDEVLEWTMLDRDFNDRSREVFRHQPVFVPMWWGRYDPGFGRAMHTSSAPTTSSAPSGRATLPSVPGADFAASIVTGIQNFAGGVVGNITDFTGNITNNTNPLPKTTYTSSGSHGSSGGGRSCACACACAGCACACAGGGR